MHDNLHLLRSLAPVLKPVSSRGAWGFLQALVHTLPRRSPQSTLVHCPHLDQSFLPWIASSTSSIDGSGHLQQTSNSPWFIAGILRLKLRPSIISSQRLIHYWISEAILLPSISRTGYEFGSRPISTTNEASASTMSSCCQPRLGLPDGSLANKPAVKIQPRDELSHWSIPGLHLSEAVGT